MYASQPTEYGQRQSICRSWWCSYKKQFTAFNSHTKWYNHVSGLPFSMITIWYWRAGIRWTHWRTDNGHTFTNWKDKNTGCHHSWSYCWWSHAATDTERCQIIRFRSYIHWWRISSRCQIVRFRSYIHWWRISSCFTIRTYLVLMLILYTNLVYLNCTLWEEMQRCNFMPWQGWLNFGNLLILLLNEKMEESVRPLL